MTGTIRIQIKAPFGEVIVEGESPEEVIDVLEGMPSGLMQKIDELVSAKLMPPLNTQLKGIVELTTEGPVIATRHKLTHYEAIGLVLFASGGGTETANQINVLLQSSGMKSMVPARLNEMTKRGLVFKPDRVRPEFKLTSQGEKWIKETVLPRLKENK
ncbi:MAG: hypothetical protein V3T10_05630 [Candidatus Bathyarchaeia archaeon]